MNSNKTVYYAFILGDLIACIIGIANFVERYSTYGKLERGEITTIQAGIGEVTGDKIRFIRRKQNLAPKSSVEAIKMRNLRERLGETEISDEVQIVQL